MRYRPKPIENHKTSPARWCTCHLALGHRVDLGSWERCNFYQIRPASEACNFYKIRPEIWGQLLQFKARFRIFPPPPWAAVFFGSFFRLVRLDLGPVQDFGIPVREHSARIETSKNEFWGGQNPHFLSACRRQCPPRGARHAIASRGRPGRELSMASSFYSFMARSAAFTK